MPFTKLVLQRETKTLFCISNIKLPREENVYFYKAVNLKCIKKLIQFVVRSAPVTYFRGFLLGWLKGLGQEEQAHCQAEWHQCCTSVGERISRVSVLFVKGRMLAGKRSLGGSKAKTWNKEKKICVRVKPKLGLSGLDGFIKMSYLIFRYIYANLAMGLSVVIFWRPQWGPPICPYNYACQHLLNHCTCGAEVRGLKQSLV